MAFQVISFKDPSPQWTQLSGHNLIWTERMETQPLTQTFWAAFHSTDFHWKSQRHNHFMKNTSCFFAVVKAIWSFEVLLKSDFVVKSRHLISIASAWTLCIFVFALLAFIKFILHKRYLYLVVGFLWLSEITRLFGWARGVGWPVLYNLQQSRINAGPPGKPLSCRSAKRLLCQQISGTQLVPNRAVWHSRRQGQTDMHSHSNSNKHSRPGQA